MGAVDLQSWTVSDIGPIARGNPELTGTAWGELWGFFPQSNPPTITQIDKDTGAFLTSYPLPLSSDANAWAFAFWGGDFYVFYKAFADWDTTVYRMPIDGSSDLEVFVQSTGRYIVGAGISTCAPVKWP